MTRTIRRALFAASATGALLLSFVLPSSSPAVSVFPGQDACKAVNDSAPKGNCGPFQLLYRETFNEVQVPLGRFSNCGGDWDHRCEGLRAGYPRYYSTLGAYPDGWPDTAASGADGNNGPVPGYYRPQDTMSVIKQPNNDGQMRVRMWRPTSGAANHVAAPVPIKCMNLRYGKFTERMIVRTTTPGFKAAHLHYSPDEIDYPEAGGNFASDPIYAYTHGFASTSTYVASNASWRSWHTYSTEITPGKVKIYFDNKLIRTISGDYPRATPWVLQNESALGDGPGAAPGSSVVIDSSWLNCYRYAP